MKVEQMQIRYLVGGLQTQKSQPLQQAIQIAARSFGHTNPNLLENRQFPINNKMHPAVQVIQLHPYKLSYPFGLQKQSQCTYVELIKQVASETQLHTYKQNLALFKSIQSQLIIPLDSYVRQANTLQLYYYYQPLSIKNYIEERLVMMAEEQHRDKFLTKAITSINVAIEDVIALLTGKKVMALLSIENMAVGKQEKIKFFIYPDFDYVQKPTPNQLNEYYVTEKKKLQIQLQEFLQHIFSYTNTKSKDHGKANFVIQGTKLVFVNDQEANRQSSMSGVNVISAVSSHNTTSTTNTTSVTTVNIPPAAIPTQQHAKHEIKLPAYMLKDPNPKQAKQPQQQSNINNSSKQKFDIKNILDQKKLQKNQPHIPQTIKQHKQPQHTAKQSFGQVAEDQRQNQKDVKNYFENNDDFNKDASFYPEEFIKEDSIAEFDGYEDELEKELEDLKKKKLEAEQLADNSTNRLSMVPNTPINPQLPEQKHTTPPISAQSLPQTKASNQAAQTLLNSSDSRQNDTSQQQQKQKKKYKVTITTSHLVDVDDQNPDMKTIEQELIEDIKKGTIQHNPEGTGDGKQQQKSSQQGNVNLAANLTANLTVNLTANLKANNQKEGTFATGPNLPAHLLKGHTRDTHNPSPHQMHTTHQSLISQQKPSVNLASSVAEQHTAQQRPFSKQNMHFSSDTSTYYPTKEPSYNSGTFTHGGNTTTSNQQAPDIKKIIEKIKSNSQNHQFINSTNATAMTGSIQAVSSSKPMVQSQMPKPQIQEETRLQSQLSSQGGTGVCSAQNSEKKEQQKEYNDKIQKAKMKAEEIMKLVKERKGQ